MSVFRDPLARIHPDPDHSTAEEREIIVGHSISGRLSLGVKRRFLLPAHRHARSFA